jgi:hypothetical protein
VVGESRVRGGRRRSFDLGRWSRRGRYLGVAALVGLVTVAVPPLIAPGRVRPAGSGTPAIPAAPATSAAATAPSPVPSVSPSAAEPAGPLPCAAPQPGTASARPSCAVYTATLGTGWRIESTGVKVVPGGLVPGTDIVAIRVEPKEKVASVALVAASAVTVPQRARLKLRVYGGRVHGTVLRLTMPVPGRPPGSPVMLTAPADRFTDFTVELGDLLGGTRTVQRIDLGIATDLVPNAYRFFVDHVEFVG